jgi:metal-responsive CopG/Arc/MetJ family transcriptional regulator
MTENIPVLVRLPKELVKNMEEEMKKKHIFSRNQLIINILVERYQKK